MTESREARIIELETRAAHQEVAIQELSDVVLIQQGRIQALEEGLERLRQFVQATADAGPETDPGSEIPPHY